MYCLRLFIVVLQELHCLLQHLLIFLWCVPIYTRPSSGCYVSEIKGHLCFYHNVWPEAKNYIVY